MGGGACLTKHRDLSNGKKTILSCMSLEILHWNGNKCCNTQVEASSHFQCRFVHILQEGDLLVCPVIVIRDLDHYCFAIHLVIVPESLVELFESLCISYVNMNKHFINRVHVCVSAYFLDSVL